MTSRWANGLTQKTTISATPSCNNPYGKKGCPEHQETIADAEANLRECGYNVTKEYRVPTPGGIKEARYLDLYAESGNVRFGVQVGVANKSGLPVSREVKAIMDIENTGIRVFFIAYRTTK